MPSGVPVLVMCGLIFSSFEMMVNNKIERFLPPAYSWFVFVFVAMGLVALGHKQWVVGFPCWVLAWYLLATYSGVEMDCEKRLFRPYNRHWGLWTVGQWRSLDSYLGVTLVPVRRVYSVFSRSNLRMPMSVSDYRIYLVDLNKKPAVCVKVCKNKEEGQRSMDELAIWLKMPVYSVKNNNSSLAGKQS